MQPELATEEFTTLPKELITAGYYALGRLLGHEVVSLNAILANRVTGEFAENPEQVMNELIARTLPLL